nr:MAG TPA_asm: hypothetical protein [Caudoviricetes sp.]
MFRESHHNTTQKFFATNALTRKQAADVCTTQVHLTSQLCLTPALFICKYLDAIQVYTQCSPSPFMTTCFSFIVFLSPVGNIRVKIISALTPWSFHSVQHYFPYSFNTELIVYKHCIILAATCQ